jgi:hypothetical protein
MKRKPYNNAEIDTAHSVRTLRTCDYCDGIGNNHSMLQVEIAHEKVWMHGRCFIRSLGMLNFLKLPRRETRKMRLDDIGVRAMKTLVNS